MAMQGQFRHALGQGQWLSAGSTWRASSKSIDQIGLTYDFKNKPKASDIFTSEYLPPAKDRML